MADSRGGGSQGVLTLLALAAAVAGTLVIVVAVLSQQEPAKAPRPAAGGVETPPAAKPRVSAAPLPRRDVAAAVEDATDDPLPPSRPTAIVIPKIDVRSAVFPLGLARDGSLQVPRPGPHLNDAAWFENSPTPGQPGPSVIEGHVDTDRGPSVFFHLGDLRPGDKIRVTREDGRTAVFQTYAVRVFEKKRFPTRLVYGSDLAEPTLRLITCADFDESTGHHTGNLVVFSRLVAVRGGPSRS